MLLVYCLKTIDEYLMVNCMKATEKSSRQKCDVFPQLAAHRGSDTTLSTAVSVKWCFFVGGLQAW